MRNEKTQIAREDLYDQVWNESMSKLAKQYGLSDVGLAKICKKMGIPRPGRGHWTRVNSGRIPPKPRLPKLKDNQVTEVILYPKEMVSLTANGHTEVDRLISQEKDPGYLINVTEEITDPHRLIDRTSKSLRGAKANDHHIVRPRAKHCLDVEITKGSIDRAMRVMDALIKAFEQRGFEVTVGEQEQTQVTILGETLGIHLEERIQRVPHVMTSQEEKRVARDPYYHFQIPDFDYQPTGKLTFSIVGH